MKKICMLFTAIFIASLLHSQNIENARLKYIDNALEKANESHWAAYAVFNAVSNGGKLPRKSTRYRIIGASAGEMGTLTDTVKLKFSGNRESTGLIFQPYLLYQFAYPYESDPYDELIAYKKSGPTYTTDKRYTKKYDADGRVTETIDSLFGQKNRFTYTYNANKKVELGLGEVNYGSGWSNYAKYEFTYATGKQTKTTYSWSSGNWNVTAKEEIYGDVAAPDSVITLQLKRVYTYNSNGDITVYVEYNNPAQGFVPSRKELHTYNTAGKVNEIMYQAWDGTAWQDYAKRKITYTAGGDIDSSISMTITGSTTANSLLTIYTYQGSKLKNFTNFGWNNGWTATNKFEFILDGQQNLNQVHFYVNQNGNLNFVRRYRYYHESYTNTTGINEEATAANGIHAYPNPASTAITFEAPALQPATLCIYNLTGKLLWKQTMEPQNGTVKTIVDLQSLPLKNGLYFYTLATEQGLHTAKFAVSY